MESQVSQTPIRDMINQSRFSERIKYLLENPGLGHEPVVARDENYKERSNCWGTVVFLVGGMQNIVDNWPHSYMDGRRIIRAEGSGVKGQSFFLADDSRPGYVSKEHLRWFFDKMCCGLEVPQIDSVISLDIMKYDGEGCPDGSVFHTGLYLGDIDHSPVYVDQNGLGGEFRVASSARLAVLRKNYWNYVPN